MVFCTSLLSTARLSESVARWWHDEYIIADEDDPERRGPNHDWDDRPLHAVVLSMSTLVREGGVVRAELRYPDEPDRAPWEHGFQFELGDPGSGITYVLPYAGELRGVLLAYSFVSSVNREHPLVQEALRSQYTLEKSDTGRFAEELVYLLTQRLTLRAIVEEWPTDRQELRYLGSLYLLAKREGMPADMKPPYRLWSRGTDIVELDEERLERWAGTNWSR